MKPKSTILTLFFILCTSYSFAQNNQNFQTVFPGGISINYGLGNYSVKDRYISQEKYSGTLSCFSADWKRFHNKNGFRLGLEFRNSSQIKNNNVSADVVQFSLNLDYLYPFTIKKMFSKNLMIMPLSPLFWLPTPPT